MNEVTNFISAAEDYAARRGFKASTVSRLIFNDGKVIERLKSGKTITIRRLDGAKVRLAELESELTASVREGDQSQMAAA